MIMNEFDAFGQKVDLTQRIREVLQVSKGLSAHSDCCCDVMAAHLKDEICAELPGRLDSLERIDTGQWTVSGDCHHGGEFRCTAITHRNGTYKSFQHVFSCNVRLQSGAIDLMY